MKKIYLFLGLTAIVGQAIAQTPTNSRNYPEVKKTKHSSLNEVINVKPATQHQAKGVTLWSDEFDTPGNWVMTNSSAPISWDWVITTNPNAMPNAAGDLFPFASTTAANGYALIDSDGQPGNANGDGAIVAQMTNATPIDLTGQPFVSLKFQHNYRWWQDTRGVRVSGDNGGTWTEFEITNNAGYPNLQNSANPEIEMINISSVAGNSSEVLIQFYYNDNDFWGWYWVIDDVEIVETDEFDLAVTGLYWGSTGGSGSRLPYYQVPVNQIAAIDLGGRVTNFGYANQSDVVFSINETASSFTGSSANTTIATFAVDTLELTTQFTPPGLGTYSFDASVTSPATDAVPADNTVTGMASVIVTNNTYARDRDNITGGTLNRDGGIAAGYQVGNEFDIFTNATLYGVDFYVSPSTDVESDYSVALYDTNLDFIAESQISIIEASDLDTWITVAFDSPINLQAGTSYVAVVGSQGGIGENGLVTGTSGLSAPQTSFYYDFVDATWYFTTATPMVRMNFDLSLNTEVIANNSMNLTVYPNPAQNVANVEFELENNSNVALTISDLSGKVVFTTTENNVSAGKNTIAVPTSGLANGVYTYTFVAGNTVITEKLVINK